MSGLLNCLMVCLALAQINDNYVIFDELRAVLMEPLLSYGKIELLVSIIAPEKPGIYQSELTMV